MKLFVVKIIQYTARGKEIEVANRFINTNLTYDELRNKLAQDYKPLGVRVSEVETIETIEEKTDTKLINNYGDSYRVIQYKQSVSLNKDELETISKILDQNWDNKNKLSGVLKEVKKRVLKEDLRLDVLDSVVLNCNELGYRNDNPRVTLTGNMNSNKFKDIQLNQDT